MLSKYEPNHMLKIVDILMLGTLEKVKKITRKTDFNNIFI